MNTYLWTVNLTMAMYVSGQYVRKETLYNERNVCSRQDEVENLRESKV